MKILMVADHESRFIWDHFDPSRFSEIDLIISCGDLKSEYLSFLVTMVNKPLFFVNGNHDTHYQRQPPEGCESIDGRVVVYQGVRILGLGGSMKYGKDPIRSAPPYQYTEKQMDKRIRKLTPKIRRLGGIDLLVTHSPAKGVCDGLDICHTGFSSLLTLMAKWQPPVMVHGHMHMGFGQGKRFVIHGQTTVYDAFEYFTLTL